MKRINELIESQELAITLVEIRISEFTKKNDKNAYKIHLKRLQQILASLESFNARIEE